MLFLINKLRNITIQRCPDLCTDPDIVGERRNSMKRKHVQTAVVTTLMAAMLTGCGSVDRVSDDAVTIRVWGAEEDQTLLVLGGIAALC